MKKEQLKKKYNALFNKMGINLEEYNQPELFEKIADLLVFPAYAIKIVSQPIKYLFLIALIAIIVSFYSGNAVFGFVLIFLGIPLTIVNGFFWGQVVFVNKISDDINRILDFSLQLTRTTMEDMREIKGKITDESLQLPKFSVITKGLLLTVLLPNLETIVRKKIPFLGRFIASVCSRIVFVLAKKIEESENEIRKEIAIDEKTENLKDRVGEYISKGELFVGKLEDKIDDYVKITTKVAAYPLTILATILSLLSIFVLLLFFFVFV
ncbi:MAG: hypothetical protein CSA05_02365 [Bacteroidia bacterium]|nr:MAG: hypothetical protein CSA05_02365 [Bacteroidia bacterium]